MIVVGENDYATSKYSSTSRLEPERTRTDDCSRSCSQLDVGFLSSIYRIN